MIVDEDRLHLRLVVTGDRDWKDRDTVRRVLYRIADLGRYVRLAHGACPTGLDPMAASIGSVLGWDVEDYPADWSTGAAGGPARNARMLERERPHLVLAFHDDLGRSRGTRDCVLRAKRMGIRVKVIRSESTKPPLLVYREQAGSDGVRRGAIFSPCERYRYLLTRRWGPESADLPTATVVMLNPSTADHVEDDPTVARVLRRAREWWPEAGGLEVANIFGLRSTDPKALRSDPDPVGPHNDANVVLSARKARSVIVAWGAHGDLMGRGREVERLLRSEAERNELLCLGTTKDGHPRHPLYLRTDEPLVPWSGYGEPT